MRVSGFTLPASLAPNDEHLSNKKKSDDEPGRKRKALDHDPKTQQASKRLNINNLAESTCFKCGKLYDTPVNLLRHQAVAHSVLIKRNTSPKDSSFKTTKKKPVHYTAAILKTAPKQDFHQDLHLTSPTSVPVHLTEAVDTPPKDSNFKTTKNKPVHYTAAILKTAPKQDLHQDLHLTPTTSVPVHLTEAVQNDKDKQDQNITYQQANADLKTTSVQDRNVTVVTVPIHEKDVLKDEQYKTYSKPVPETDVKDAPNKHNSKTVKASVDKDTLKVTIKKYIPSNKVYQTETMCKDAPKDKLKPDKHAKSSSRKSEHHTEPKLNGVSKSDKSIKATSKKSVHHKSSKSKKKSKHDKHISNPVHLKPSILDHITTTKINKAFQQMSIEHEGAKLQNDSAKSTPIPSSKKTRKSKKIKDRTYGPRERTFNNYNHECSVCYKTFITPSKLKRHQKSHTNSKPFTCEQCNKKFSRVDNLNTHVISVHKHAKLYECIHCKKRFSSNHAKLYHELKCKTGEFQPKIHNPLFFCDFCKIGVAQKRSLKSHICRKHLLERRFQCSKCDKDFCSKFFLRRHFTSVHKKQKPFSCAHCPHRCALKSNLVFHYLAKHAKNKR